MVRPVETTRPISVILTWVFKIFVLVFFGILIMFPFYYMINQSLLDKYWQNDQNTLVLFPLKFPDKKGVDFHFENFRTAAQAGYLKAIVTTAGITALSVVLRIFFSITFGYAFSIKKWRFKQLSWGFFLALLVLPEVALMAGQYLVVVRLGWHVDWKISPIRIVTLTMPFAASVFSGFMYRNSFESIQGVVRQSSMLDGASAFAYFTKIAMPMVKATTWTVAILTALASWNSFSWPLLILSKQEPGSWTVMNIWLMEVGKSKESAGEVEIIYTSIRMAGTILGILPMFVVYFVLRKRIMNAISRQGNATKG
ncbi:carbohydrate ABC transporter permease [Metamycoplasma subdolum]|nr:carbohydrate ABC transporter permease [Metamycoplasma subdolum]WPB50619.1 carbohydrate ABC transporter permease [Metamycoplasma subdolum]